MLARSDPRVRTEPVTADRARSLAGLRHGDSSSPRLGNAAALQFRRPGSFLESRGGKFLASAAGSANLSPELPGVRPEAARRHGRSDQQSQPHAAAGQREERIVRSQNEGVAALDSWTAIRKQNYFNKSAF